MKLFFGCMKTPFACTITLTLTKTGQQAAGYGQLLLNVER